MNQSVQKDRVLTRKKHSDAKYTFQNWLVYRGSSNPNASPATGSTQCQTARLQENKVRTQKRVVPKHGREHIKLIPEPNQRMWSEGLERYSKALRCQCAKHHLKNTCLKYHRNLIFMVRDENHVQEYSDDVSVICRNSVFHLLPEE